jgi:hypothetical protein
MIQDLVPMVRSKFRPYSPLLTGIHRGTTPVTILSSEYNPISSLALAESLNLTQMCLIGKGEKVDVQSIDSYKSD